MDENKNVVIAASSHSEAYAQFFDQSCARNGVTPTILGMGKEWKNYGTKLYLLKDYVNSVDDDTVVLFLDRFDLIVLRPLEPLFEFYRDQLKQRNGRPLLYISNEQRDSTGLYKAFAFLHWGLHKDSVINSGSYIATAGLLKKMLNEICTEDNIKNHMDDQEMIIKYLQNHGEVDVILDNNRRFLVYSTLRMDIGRKVFVDDVSKQLLFHNELYKKTYKPFVLHRNGNGKMTRILQQLGYNTDGVDVTSSHVQRVFEYHVPRFFSDATKRVKNMF